MREIHLDVWERGVFTAFYVREKLYDAIPTIRMVYTLANHEIEGAYTFPVEENWKECIERNAGTEALSYASRTCSTTVDLRTIPAWAPSPNDQTKRRIEAHLRDEIQAKWPGVQEIVIRNFNLKDNQITMYLKMPDGDY